MDDKHDFFCEHDLRYDAESDNHIHTSNLLLPMHLVEEANGKASKEEPCQGKTNTSDVVFKVGIPSSSIRTICYIFASTVRISPTCI